MNYIGPKIGSTTFNNHKQCWRNWLNCYSIFCVKTSRNNLRDIHVTDVWKVVKSCFEYLCRSWVGYTYCFVGVFLWSKEDKLHFRFKWWLVHWYTITKIVFNLILLPLYNLQIKTKSNLKGHTEITGWQAPSIFIKSEIFAFW